MRRPWQDWRWWQEFVGALRRAVRSRPASRLGLMGPWIRGCGVMVTGRAYCAHWPRVPETCPQCRLELMEAEVARLTGRWPEWRTQ